MVCAVLPHQRVLRPSAEELLVGVEQAAPRHQVPRSRRCRMPPGSARPWLPGCRRRQTIAGTSSAADVEFKKCRVSLKLQEK
jgi:hypothetical protein